MLDDFRQDKQEQPLDPLAEGSQLPWSKKIALLCVAVALIGLFIFFTSDGWGSDTKSKDIAKRLEDIDARLAALESAMPKQQLVASATLAAEPVAQPSGNTETLNLKSIIDQELQDQPSQQAEAQPEAVVPEQKPAPAQKTYTIQKGDSLSKISQKFYGTPKKWKKILDANKDKLGNGQVLKIGTTINIPTKDEA
jgi:LysM repeat protein